MADKNTGARVNTIKYAHIRQKDFQAISNELFRYRSLEQASQKLSRIRASYTVAKENDPEDETTLKLWIKGFGTTNDEKKKGYVGNYGVISILRLPDGHYTLRLEKIAVELKRHPARKRPKRLHPNWGHPILRSLRNKGIKYKSFDDAWWPLQQLHEEFPKASIPGPQKLYLMIFTREAKPPVKKYIFEIKKEGEEFFIDVYENTFQETKIEQKVDETVDTLYSYLYIN